MKLLTIVSLFLSLSTAASNLCEKRVQELLKDYANNGMPVESYSIKTCTSLTTPEPYSIENGNRNTNAPNVYNTDACLILLNTGALADTYVIDNENNFEYRREFDKADRQKIAKSRFGDRKTGLYSTSKHEGDYLEDGFLNKTYYISRVNYNYGNGKMRLLKWKLGWFSNKYSHDYTVQCK